MNAKEYIAKVWNWEVSDLVYAPTTLNSLLIASGKEKLIASGKEES